MERKANRICGELKLSWYASKGPIKIGSTIPGLFSSNGEDLGDARWNGFARSETLEDWTSKGWEEGIIEVEGFTEKGLEFDIPVGHGIQAVYLSKEIGTFFNIVTRKATDNPAATDENGETLTEKDIHGRYPVIVDLPGD